MESYKLPFTALKGNQNLPATGTLFVYESCVVPTNGENRVLVKPASGGSIILKPGQWFRATETINSWAISSFNGNDIIDAVFIVGAGEFGDANTLNTFKLDGTFSNTVTVANTAANRVPVTVDPAGPVLIGNTVAARVPVTLDTAQLLKLDPSQPLNISGQLVAYTTAYASTAASVANTAIQMLSAATNANGVILNSFSVIASATMVFAVIAKATAPANITDGDVLFSGFANTAGPLVRIALSQSADGQFKAPAGKAIWYIATNVDGNNLREALFTVL